MVHVIKVAMFIERINTYAIKININLRDLLANVFTSFDVIFIHECCCIYDHEFTTNVVTFFGQTNLRERI